MASESCSTQIIRLLSMHGKKVAHGPQSSWLCWEPCFGSLPRATSQSECRIFPARITVSLMRYLIFRWNGFGGLHHLPVTVLLQFPRQRWTSNGWRSLLYARRGSSIYTSILLHVRRYLAFCTAGRRIPFPASENQLIDFAAFVAQSAGYGTIKVYLAGIRLEHIQRGLQNPFSSCPRLQLVLRGIRRKLARTPRPRLPITVDILRKVKRSLRHASDMSPYDVALTWAACTLAFFGSSDVPNSLPSA